MVRDRPSRCSSEITGSKFAIASIRPAFTAATAAAPPPTPMIATSSAVSDALPSSMRSPMALAEPGPVTPIFMPLRSGNPW